MRKIKQVEIRLRFLVVNRLPLLCVGCVLAFNGYSQIDFKEFKSKQEKFSISIPVDPSTEQLDTVEVEQGLLPRYLLMVETTEHGRNLLYTVEVLHLDKLNDSDLDITFLTQYVVNKKNIGGFTLLDKKKNTDSNDPYEVELVFKDAHDMSLNYAKLFIHDQRFFSVETYAIKGQFKLGTKPNKLTRTFFESFYLEELE